MNTSIYIMIFKNTTDAIKGQRTFDECGFAYRLMPAPTSLTGCCGNSLVFYEDVYSELKNVNIEYKNVYIKRENGIEIVK